VDIFQPVFIGSPGIGPSCCPGDGKICAAKIGGTKNLYDDIFWLPQRDAARSAQSCLRKNNFINEAPGYIFPSATREPRPHFGKQFFWPPGMGDIVHYENSLEFGIWKARGILAAAQAGVVAAS
jgi:hypothetical protein